MTLDYLVLGARGQGNACIHCAAGRTGTGMMTLRLCSFMVSAKAQKPQEKNPNKINVWFDILLQNCAEKHVRRPEHPGKLNWLHLEKGYPKVSLPDAGCTATPSVSQNNTGCEGLKGTKTEAIFNVQAGNCFYVSSCHISSGVLMAAWGQRSRLGTEHRTWSPALLGLCAC